ncbi:MAG TPA: thioredoxin [Thermoanaerobaculia bacterium]|nr:thioredoxin [Thermoanaerobaculia bacterium]
MQEVSEKEFDNLVGGGIVLVDFGAEWCGPCKAMLPVMRKLSTEYEGKLNVYSVDIDKTPSLAARHGVMSVPTMLFFKEGAAVDRIVGAVSEKELRKRIEQTIAG